MPNDLVKFDPSKLKAEIDNQRKEMLQKNPELAKKVNNAGKGKKFISELKASMVHGVKTEASESIKAVNKTADNIAYGGLGQIAKTAKQAQPQQRQVMHEQTIHQPSRTGASDWGIAGGSVNTAPVQRGNENDRDASFEQAFMQKNDAFDQMMMRGAAKNNPNLQKFLDANPNANQYMNQPEQVVIAEQFNGGSSANVNDQLQQINEKVERNLEKMVESAFKGVLTNIYTKQKIHEALGDFLESEEFVKIVGEAIVKISQRKKTK